MKDFGLIRLLFSQQLFKVAYPSNNDLFNLAACANESWDNIWSNLVGNKSNLEWISQSIVTHMRDNQSDVSYIIKMNEWIQAQFSEKGKEEFMEIGIKNGIIEQILKIIMQLNNNSEFYDQVTALFCIIKLMIENYSKNEFPGAENLIDMMFKAKLLNDTNSADMCITCISRILMFKNELAYKRFETQLNETVDIDVMLSLLSTIQEVLKNSKTKDRSQKYFIRAGTLKTLKIKLTNDLSKFPREKVIDLWANVLESVRFLIENNRYCKKRIHEFDFNMITNTVMKSNYAHLRKDICIRTIDSLFYILFDTKNLVEESGHRVNTPEVIPLVIELLFDIELPNDCNTLMNYIEHVLIKDVDSAHFACRRTTDILLHVLEKNETNSNLNFIEDVLSRVICHHITPQELRKIIEVAQASKDHPEKQIMIYKSLYRGIENAFCSIDHIKFEKNHLGLSPTRYFCFRSPKSKMSCCNKDNISFISKKEFSLFVWIYPDVIELDKEYCLLEFSDKNRSSKLSLMIKYGGHLYLEYQDKFRVGSVKRILDNQWNLVGFSIRQGTRFVKKYEVDILIKNELCEKNLEGRIVYPKDKFSRLTCGNSSLNDKPFIGKMTTIYMTSKCLQEKHFTQIYNFSFQYTLGYNPVAVSTSENFDGNKVLLKEIWQSRIFQWDPRCTYPEFAAAKLEVKDKCERFNGVTILEAVAANGGLNIFLPLIKECASQNDQAAILIINMIGCICQAQSLDSIITEEFLDLLGMVIEDSVKDPGEELLDAIKKVVGKLDWDAQYQQQALRSLLFSKSLWEKLHHRYQESYLWTLSLYISKYYRCNVEHVTAVYNHLSCLENSPYYINFSENCKEILEKLLPRKIKKKHLDGLFCLCFNMINDKSYKMLEKLLLIIKDIKVSKKCTMDISNLMLFILREFKDTDIQCRSFNVLLRFIEDYIQIEDLNSLNHLFIELDETMDGINTNSCKAIFSFLKSHDSEDKYRNKLLALIDLITNRIFESREKEAILSELTKSASEISWFSSELFLRDEFPHWLIENYTSVSKGENFEKLFMAIFTSEPSFYDWNKLRNFLTEISGLNNGIAISMEYFLRILEFNIRIEVFKNNLNSFISFMCVLEDLLNPMFAEQGNVNKIIYYKIIKYFVDIGKELGLWSCTFPYIPNVPLNILKTICHEVKDKIISIWDVSNREGGYLRIILKLILIGIDICQDQLIIDELSNILKGDAPAHEPYLKLNSQQSQDWRSILSESSDCKLGLYIRFAPEIDGFYSEEFLTLYIIAECVELLNKEDSQPILTFLKEFIKSVEAWSKIKNIVKLLDPTDLVYFPEFFAEYKNEFFYGTSRSRYKKSKHFENFNCIREEEINPEMFQAKCEEMAEALKQAKDSESNLRQLLISTDWINYIHLICIALTSIKLNLISSAVYKSVDSPKPEKQNSRDAYYPGMIYKRDQLKWKQRSYEQREERSKLLQSKKYHNFSKKHDDLNSFFSKEEKVYKIRPSLDKIGRMPLIQAINNQTRMSIISQSSLPTKPLVPDQDLARSYSVLLRNDDAIRKDSIDGTVYQSTEDEENENGPISEVQEDIEELKEEDTLKLAIKYDCERIKIKGSYFGSLEIANTWLLFSSDNDIKSDEEQKYLGSALPFTRYTKKCRLIWGVDEIAEVLPRRFIHRHTAIEVFFKSGKSCLLNLFDNEVRNLCLNEMKSWKKYGVTVVEKIDQKYVSRIMKNWKLGKLSNFEYLSVLNKLASRSFNDISQYPVFPWIVKDFESTELQLEDPETYRDFRYPIGAQTEAGRQEVGSKFSMWQDEEIRPFHYGSHYSSAGIVVHYLIRLQPFTDQALSLQGGSFDVPDRLFYSIKTAWESSQTTAGDVKEMIPEMFYLPEMLKNVNNFPFGTRQDQINPISDVDLPPWAKGSPINFIRKHRQALESDYVSQNLNLWIDLIFGYKQKGSYAESSLNKFYYTTYEETLEKLIQGFEKKEAINAVIEQIVHFGQTPIQLFKSQHPQREIKPKQITIFSKATNKIFDTSDVKSHEIVGRIFALFTTQNSIIGIKLSGNGAISAFKLNFKKEIGETRLDTSSYQEYQLEAATDLVLDNWKEEPQWKHTFNNDDSRFILDKGPHQYCMWGEKLIISGFHIDNSFKIHNLKGILQESVHHHSGLVTCVASTDDLLFTGSLDTSICSWGHIGQNAKAIKPKRIYLGHTVAIRQIVASSSFQVLVSLSSNGTILMHDIRTADCLRSFEKMSNDPPKAIAISELGIIASAISEENLIVLYSLNGDKVGEFAMQNDMIWCMQFNPSGEYLITGGTEKIRFQGIFDAINVQKDVKSTVMAICLPRGQEFIIYALNKEKALICTLDLYSKDHRKNALANFAALA